MVAEAEAVAPAEVVAAGGLESALVAGAPAEDSESAEEVLAAAEDWEPAQGLAAEQGSKSVGRLQ